MRVRGTPFHWAAAYGNVTALFHLLLPAGRIPIDFRTPQGETALWLSCCYGHWECAALLESRGADLYCSVGGVVCYDYLFGMRDEMWRAEGDDDKENEGRDAGGKKIAAVGDVRSGSESDEGSDDDATSDGDSEDDMSRNVKAVHDGTDEFKSKISSPWGTCSLLRRIWFAVQCNNLSFLESAIQKYDPQNEKGLRRVALVWAASRGNIQLTISLLLCNARDIETAVEASLKVSDMIQNLTSGEPSDPTSTDTATNDPNSNPSSTEKRTLPPFLRIVTEKFDHSQSQSSLSLSLSPRQSLLYSTLNVGHLQLPAGAKQVATFSHDDVAHVLSNSPTILGSVCRITTIQTEAYLNLLFLLIERKADVNECVRPNAGMCLYEAILARNVIAVEWLLQRGVLLYQINDQHYTNGQLALLCGQKQIYSLILGSGAEKAEDLKVFAQEMGLTDTFDISPSDTGSLASVEFSECDLNGFRQSIMNVMSRYLNWSIGSADDQACAQVRDDLKKCLSRKGVSYSAKLHAMLSGAHGDLNMVRHILCWECIAPNATLDRNEVAYDDWILQMYQMSSGTAPTISTVTSVSLDQSYSADETPRDVSSSEVSINDSSLDPQVSLYPSIIVTPSPTLQFESLTVPRADEQDAMTNPLGRRKDYSLPDIAGLQSEDRANLNPLRLSEFPHKSDPSVQQSTDTLGTPYNTPMSLPFKFGVDSPATFLDRDDSSRTHSKSLPFCFHLIMYHHGYMTCLRKAAALTPNNDILSLSFQLRYDLLISQRPHRLFRDVDLELWIEYLWLTPDRTSPTPSPYPASTSSPHPANMSGYSISECVALPSNFTENELYCLKSCSLIGRGHFLVDQSTFQGTHIVPLLNNSGKVRFGVLFLFGIYF